MIYCELIGKVGKGYCRQCKSKLVGRATKWCSETCCQLFYSNHLWTFARDAARIRDNNKCIKCGGNKGGLEVNHKNPLGGARYGNSCAHHLDNLETLCHKCHVIFTNETRKVK